MSTIVRRKRTSRKALGPNRIYELLTGEIVYCSPDWYDGYGDFHGQDLRAFIGDEMRQDWETHRDELMAFWRSEKPAWDVWKVPDSLPHLYIRGDRRTLPWAAKQFDKA